MPSQLVSTQACFIAWKLILYYCSASGLGRATVRCIVQAGGYVSILDMNKEGGQALVNEFGHNRAKLFVTDVSNTASVAKSVQGTLLWAKQTGKAVGGVVAAAGVGNPAKIIDRHGKPFELDGFDFVMNINVRGTIDLIRQVLPNLSKVEPTSPDGERGILIIVSSSAAFDGQPGQVAYAASKGALVSLTLPLTRDLAQYGIRVVTIAPSVLDSPMTYSMSAKVRDSLTKAMEFPLRPGKPEEFARFGEGSN